MAATRCSRSTCVSRHGVCAWCRSYRWKRPRLWRSRSTSPRWRAGSASARVMSSFRRALLLAAAMQAVVGVAYALLGDRMSFHDAWPAMLLFLAVEFPGSIVTDLVAPTSWPDWAVFGL